MDIPVASMIFLPRTNTDNDSGFNLCPLQSEHGLSDINFSISSFIFSESELRYLFSIDGINPS